MSSDTSYVLLINPSAGAGRALEVLSDAAAALRRRGIEYRAVQTTSAEHGCDEARAAGAAGEVPVVISGDGLIGQVGGALAGSGSALGIIPGGRGNDLARVLGIPTDPEGAVDVLADGVTREIDVGEVNGRRFLGIASCGFDSDANRIANRARAVKGRLVYAYAALRALAAWRPARFLLDLDGERREFTGYSVAAANSAAFGGGMFLAPDAKLDDGQLDVVTVSDVSKLRYLRGLPQVFDGSHVDNDEVDIVRAREVAIEADRPFAVYADGDHLADLPATVRLLPRALRVIAP
ncbi:MAG: diacylglycerol/lipid kinase family protein [Solirubrobacterales bacterium]